ncbi:17628_t:CDS:2, partial [Acaulospora colombiana]
MTKDHGFAEVKRRKVSSVNITRRLLAWESEKKRQNERLFNSNESKTIDVLIDGSVRQSAVGITPYEFAKSVSHELADNSIVALVNSRDLYDMNRPLYDSCTLDFLPISTNRDSTTMDIFWHSTAHVLGLALETKYGDDVLLCDGPALTQGGFFYEFLLAEDGYSQKELCNNGSLREMISRLIRSLKIRILQENDLPDILAIMKECVTKKYPFERMLVTKDVAVEFFSTNPFKLHYISQISENEPISLYRCGSFIDLCRGPHIPHTGFLGAIELLNCTTAYWTPDLAYDNTSPQSINRVYGISFPGDKDLGIWKKSREEAQKRDHRLIAKSQQLYLIHPWSPGSVFMLPHGTRIFQKLQNYIRLKYREFGFEEVMTPVIYKKDLWEMSGHWQNYRNEMYTVRHASERDFVENEEGTYGLKPMNCPGHCLIFDSTPKSYRDLPVRIADFGSLHRNETSGALSGLTRVRQFHQDDAHIFCEKSQIFDEILASLTFIDCVYRDFKFPHYQLLLSTRSDSKYIGEISEWDAAEDALKKALNTVGKSWTVNPGDAAFYGPKIDVMVEDALHRMHQTATIQLDFQLPQRFGLKYVDRNGAEQTPVMIHRAILGSVERMMAILIEHTGGRWPFWLNPRQAIVIPVGGPKFFDYAQKVRQSLITGTEHPTTSPKESFKNGKGTDNDGVRIFKQGYRHFVDIDLSSKSLNKMIKTAQLAQYSFILVVGEKERDSRTVNVRQRDEICETRVEDSQEELLRWIKKTLKKIQQANKDTLEKGENNNNHTPDENNETLNDTANNVQRRREKLESLEGKLIELQGIIEKTFSESSLKKLFELEHFQSIEHPQTFLPPSSATIDNEIIQDPPFASTFASEREFMDHELSSPNHQDFKDNRELRKQLLKKIKSNKTKIRELEESIKRAN